jgi:transposase-like protein
MIKPDWEAIESAYRAGVLSIREIASKNGITDGAIRKRAKKENWSRDLSEKIKSKSDELVRTKEVRTKVRTENVLSERILIEANAEVIANVRMEHRGDIRKARNITNALFEELGAECADIEAFKKLGELLANPDQNGRDKLNEVYMSVISMPERVKSMKALSETLKNLITLERQAYNIDDIPKDNSINQLSDLMDKLSQEG